MRKLAKNGAKWAEEYLRSHPWIILPKSIADVLDASGVNYSNHVNAPLPMAEKHK